MGKRASPNSLEKTESVKKRKVKISLGYFRSSQYFKKQYRQLNANKAAKILFLDDIQDTASVFTG